MRICRKCVICVVLCALIRHANSQDANGSQPINKTYCWNHTVCGLDQFCALSTCRDYQGRNYSCGACERCNQCVCDADSIDLACPQNRCPSQPSEGVRFIQGVFADRFRIPGFLDYICVRRLVISGASISFLQTVIHGQHPASIINAIIPAGTAGNCMTMSLSGIIYSSALNPSGAVDLEVAVTSEGPRIVYSRSMSLLPEFEHKDTHIDNAG